MTPTSDAIRTTTSHRPKRKQRVSSAQPGLVQRRILTLRFFTTGPNNRRDLLGGARMEDQRVCFGLNALQPAPPPEYPCSHLASR